MGSAFRLDSRCVVSRATDAEVEVEQVGDHSTSGGSLPRRERGHCRGPQPLDGCDQPPVS